LLIWFYALKFSPSFAGDKPQATEDQQEENLPDLIKTPMYFVFDEEAILLFENAFSFQPLHDFRFYREETSKSIDTIHVCNTEDQLEVQQGQSVYLLYPQKEHEVSSWFVVWTSYQFRSVVAKSFSWPSEHFSYWDVADMISCIARSPETLRICLIAFVSFFFHYHTLCAR
jgi:hypothetical protein